MYSYLLALLLSVSVKGNSINPPTITITFSGNVIPSNSIEIIETELTLGMTEVKVISQTNIEEYKRIENSYLVFDTQGVLRTQPLLISVRENNIRFAIPNELVAVYKYPTGYTRKQLIVWYSNSYKKSRFIAKQTNK